MDAADMLRARSRMKSPNPERQQLALMG